VVSMITAAVVGKNWFFYLIQYATMTILVLAANTAYAGFPRLGSMLAQDRFLPRQLANIGDRLVFSNGIVVLAVLSGLLVWGFKGVTHHLIPLYAVGVFLSFTLSQAGMVKRWLHHKEPGWPRGAAINGFGALCTTVVLMVFATTKFIDGAWVVVLLIPLLVVMFLRISAHYREVKKRLSLEHFPGSQPFQHTVCILVPGVHRGVIPALDYARSMSSEVRGVHVEVDPSETAMVQEKWSRWAPDIPLVVLESPYRSLIEPVLRYLDEVEAEREDDVVTVIIPEFVANKWWEKILHNHSGLLLKLALLGKRGIVVTNVRYHLNGTYEPGMAGDRTGKLGPARSEPTSSLRGGHADGKA
jgi:amino acid permease-like protein